MFIKTKVGFMSLETTTAIWKYGVEKIWKYRFVFGSVMERWKLFRVHELATFIARSIRTHSPGALTILRQKIRDGLLRSGWIATKEK